MKIEIQKQKLQHLDKLYDDVSEAIPTKKIKLICHRNKLYIKDELEAIKTVSEFSEEFKQYEKERLELLKPYMILDPSGQPIVETINGSNTVKIKKDKTIEVEEKLKEHDDKYKDAIEKQKKDNEDVEKLLLDNVAINIIKISFDDLPEVLDGNYDSNLLFEYLVDFESEIETEG